ncbi:hypothetical protein CcI49_27835 [Frankia sp. CcI49]|uniref:hypothetical protein n=1 Tax=Frankia sp. CcI49 TaxID=1745382 RepID=UPI0009768678|nr:hypothetical protein [Frankia sp. CcI49]ONH56261.1 hypothetical protein CcI49_27835 [Frankia sp. CcI49]
MPGHPSSLRVRLLWAAMFALMALVAAVPSTATLPSGAALALASAPATPTATATAQRLSATEGLDLSEPAEAVAPAVPGRADILRSWLDAKPPASSQHQRADHQVPALVAVLCALAASTAWVRAQRGPHGRGPREAGGGAGSRGPPGSRRRVEASA